LAAPHEAAGGQRDRNVREGGRPMNRYFALALTLVLALGSHAQSQEWAKKMFETTTHKFGTVARGSKQEYSFKLTNIYKETVHIEGVRSSCGCTTPKVKTATLNTHETGEIVVVYNTRSFLGAKSATITVTIDKPYYAEVQLTVSGYIRSDVVFDPGVVEFGSIDAGEIGEKKIGVSYAGRDDWEIVDVRSANRHFEVELAETYRGSGRVSYDMLVRLKPDAPVGYIYDQLVIVTNDGGARNISLPVEGQVASPMTVSPASLFLGVLKPGETVTKRLVVRSKKPFRIVHVDCSNASFVFEKPDEESKPLHFVPVVFRAGDEPGNVVQKIKIETDLGSGLCAECVATATIKPEE
jgi:hypothetical protein